MTLIRLGDRPIYSYGSESPGFADTGNTTMIPILLLDLAGVILVIGYVLLDRRQNGTPDLPNADRHDPMTHPGPQVSLPVEPIIAQRALPSDMEPRRIRRPSRNPGQPAATPVSRSDEA